MFVPLTPRGELLKQLVEVEDDLAEEIGWKCKLVEHPGTPLVYKFITKTPVEEGCPEGIK